MLNLYYVWFIILLMFSIMFLIYGVYLLVMGYSFMLEWFLFSFNSVPMAYVIYLDWYSMFFLFVVFFISSMVVLYSSIYMGDYNYSSIRFLFLVLLFVFSMLLMIMSPNLLSIMLGWDGLGLVSYCLVIYYGSLSSYLAGMITCLINRLGDIGLLITLGWIFSYGSWNFMFYLDFFSNSIYYLVILSSFTKSAQIPFSSWLPAAMAAPTPVSSLVHSSTLVTAGVYLLIRFFNSLIFINDYFLFISLMTMIMSSFCANYEFDLKSIIALSTLSQLGLMMSSLFMGLLDLSYFHLLSHAMFKSLLFLCSGIIIHLMLGCQDIRSMGSICLSMPLTCSCFNISNMSLCGLPFLSGFYSSDLIVDSSVFNSMNLIVFVLYYFGLGLTACYSIRLFYYSILMKFNFVGLTNLFEDISYMKLSILMLAFFSIVFGCLFVWLVNLDMYFMVFPFYLKISIMLMVLLGLYSGYMLNLIGNDMFFSTYYILNGSMWFMYSYSYSIFYVNYFFGKSLQVGMLWGEYYGGLGVSYYLTSLSNFFQFYSLNSLKVFFITMIFWFMAFL